jgi:hypothetical protein
MLPTKFLKPIFRSRDVIFVCLGDHAALRSGPVSTEIPSAYLFFFILKNKCVYKNGLGNAHPALFSTFLYTSYSIIAVIPRFLNISLNLTLRIYY